MNKQQIDATIKTAQAIAESIRECTRSQGYAISGHLYAALSSIGISLEQYETFLTILINGKLVKRNADHTIVWIGPFN
jgi:hypothetical protein